MSRTVKKILKTLSVPLPFKGPLYLAKQSLIAFIKIINQSKDPLDIDTAIWNLYVSMVHVLNKAKELNIQLEKIIEDSPAKKLLLSNQIGYWVWLKNWQDHLRPILKEARPFVFDYPSLRIELEKNKRLIDSKLIKIKKRKKNRLLCKDLRAC
jgi:hypothetical protein